MTAPNTLQAARDLKTKYGKLVVIKDTGGAASATKRFHQLVPSTEYRVQCIHHAAVLGIKHVLFVVAKGSSMGVGEILYIALLQFSEQLRNCYTCSLDCIRTAAFTWIRRDAKLIPKEYDALLSSSHASDLFSFASYYNLSMAYKSLVAKNGPLPPSRLIRPTMLVYWN